MTLLILFAKNRGRSVSKVGSNSVRTLERIREAPPLEGFRLRLKLTDGSVIERDVSALLTGPVFEPLRDSPAMFKRVKAEGGTVGVKGLGVWHAD